MNLEEKSAQVADLEGRFQQAQVALLARPTGLTVAEVTRLRRALRAVHGELKVAKNSLTRRAVESTPYAPLEGMLQGPNAVVFGYRDPVAVAKVLVKFAEDNGKLTIRGGVLAGRALEPQAVTDLAKLPGREALLTQVLGLLQAPAAQLLRTIQEPGARMVRLIEKLRATKAETSAQ